MSIVVLTGGVGGAKLVLGLTRVVPPETITAIVNTGDDFRHLGLPISPDLDTLLYTLSEKANRVQGWGREGESWAFMDAVRSLGGPDWFALGDGDLALHVLRNQMLAGGKTLSDVTSIFGRAWGVTTAMLPMTNDPVATIVDTDEGPLSFQDYFVARRCAPAVRAVRFEGADQACPAPGVLDAITSPEAEAILIAPSNPFLSVDPILSVPGIADALRVASAPVVAISPIVGGAAVKGPTDKIMRELGVAVTPVTIAAHYGDWMDAMLVDERDHKTPPDCVHDLADTLMKTIDDRERVARAALDLAQKVERSKRP
jgi:LPPG:FO 2-phospho-L-lactate transferase